MAADVPELRGAAWPLMLGQLGLGEGRWAGWDGVKEEASNPIAMASNLIAMASNLLAMASNPLAMASSLKAMKGFNGLMPN